MDVWIQYFEGYPKRNNNGSYNWSQLVAQVVTIADPGRPSNLLPRAVYKDCSNEILMRNRNKQNKITKKQEQNESTEEAQKLLLDDDSIDSK